MPATPEDFCVLMQRLKTGSEDAARQLFDRYGHHVRRVIRRKLDRHVRTTCDSEDFTQAVWASFFADPVQKHSFDAPEELTAFLATMARHKVIQAYRKRVNTQKRDAKRERPLPDAMSEDGGDADGGLAAARQPTPSQEASAHEQFDRLLQQVPPQYHKVLAMLKLGYTHREIAEELKLNERTVRRVVDRLRPGQPS